MLTDLMQPGVLLLGLSRYINTPGDGFDGAYRVVQMPGITAIEFLREGGALRPGLHPVNILPYAPGRINKMLVGGREVISGEFTGCVMSLFRERQMLRCAHVDTNADTTQRTAYEEQKDWGGIQVVAEYDTAGKLHVYPGLNGDTRILCIASGERIYHYFVEREQHRFSTLQTEQGGRGPSRMVSETRYRVLPSLGH